MREEQRSREGRLACRGEEIREGCAFPEGIKFCSSSADALSHGLRGECTDGTGKCGRCCRKVCGQDKFSLPVNSKKFLKSLLTEAKESIIIDLRKRYERVNE